VLSKGPGRDTPASRAYTGERPHTLRLTDRWLWRGRCPSRQIAPQQGGGDQRWISKRPATYSRAIAARKATGRRPKSAARSSPLQEGDRGVLQGELSANRQQGDQGGETHQRQPEAPSGRDWNSRPKLGQTRRVVNSSTGWRPSQSVISKAGRHRPGRSAPGPGATARRQEGLGRPNGGQGEQEPGQSW